MTPAARLAAAAELLDTIRAGTPAEQALTGWARRSRFAGSADRAAVRDHVFDALRCLRSFAALGGADTGRGLMLGALRAEGRDPADLFTGEGHAPAPLTPAEAAHLAAPCALPELVALDCPDWLAPGLRDDLGADFAPVMQAMRNRAPVFLRVNALRCTVAEAQAMLAGEGIGTRLIQIAKNGLEVIENHRKLRLSKAFESGCVELQDAASQAVIEALPDPTGMRVLDFCAGGGGKSLALAARGAQVFAHDAAPGRMRDLPARAARAGAQVRSLATAELAAAAPFDMVVLDVPCSGSGSWRRAPAGKWALTAERLAELSTIQAEILAQSVRYAAQHSLIAYMTCSLLARENDGQIAQFLPRHPHWRCAFRQRLTPLDGGDGFFAAHLTQG